MSTLQRGWMVFAWLFRKPPRRANLREPKELLSSLVTKDPAGVGKGTLQSRQSAANASVGSGAGSQMSDKQTVPNMFEYLEKKTQKRMFYNYLHQFELTVEHLGSKVSRQLIKIIHDESCKVAHAFNEPLSSVSHNIIGAAAWGTIYCLLGPERMNELRPDYRDIIDEVEMELMGAAADPISEESVYLRVFAILTEHSLCHPDVIALSEACMLSPLFISQSDSERREQGLAQG